MATSTNESGVSGKAAKRDRVTLDLAAEEVGRESGGTGFETGQPTPETLGEKLTGPLAEPGAEPAAGSIGRSRRAAQSKSAGKFARPSSTTEPAGGAPSRAASKRNPGRRRRLWPALLLSGLLGGAAGAGGVLWLDRAGYLATGAAATDGSEVEAVSGDIAALRSDVEQLRQAQAGAGSGGLQPDAIAPLQQQVAALEQSVAEIGLRPAGSPDGQVLGTIEARLAALEQRSGELGPGLAAMEDRLAGLESRPAPPPADLGSLEERLAELERRSDQGSPSEAGAAMEARLSELAGQVEVLRNAPPVDLSGLQAAAADLGRRLDDVGNRVAGAPTEDRVARLEAAMAGAPSAEQVGALESALAAVPTEERVAALESGLTETRAQAEKAQSLGPAIAANALTAALDAGAPFRAELDALRALGLDEATLGGLEPHADAGLPTRAELRSGFEQATATVDLSRPIPKDTGAVNRLLQSARGLVEVRATGPATGTDPAAIAGRIRAALEAGDLRAAVTEWQALPEPAKASTAEWAAAAEARAAADELAARLRTQALSRIAAAG